MPLSRQCRRRLTGGIVLSVALLMVIAGEFLIKGMLSPAVMLFYWLICFALTVVAMIFAVLDASAVARRTLDARRELVTHTVKEIEQQLKERQGKPKA